MLLFFMGFVLGGTIGLVLSGIFFVGKREDELREQTYEEILASICQN